MSDKYSSEELFTDYFIKWVKLYKEGAVRPITLNKYGLALSWLKRIAPGLKLGEIDRSRYQEIINRYQQLLNDYAQTHERQTTMDFHHIIKGAVLDALDEGLIDRDPTRKVIIKGKTPAEKKLKYINQYELHALLNSLELENQMNWDYFILLVAKTGLRFSVEGFLNFSSPLFIRVSPLR